VDGDCEGFRKALTAGDGISPREILSLSERSSLPSFRLYYRCGEADGDIHQALEQLVSPASDWCDPAANNFACLWEG
jgi:hypothetical protein